MFPNMSQRYQSLKHSLFVSKRSHFIFALFCVIVLASTLCHSCFKQILLVKKLKPLNFLLNYHNLDTLHWVTQIYTTWSKLGNQPPNYRLLSQSKSRVQGLKSQVEIEIGVILESKNLKNSACAIKYFCSTYTEP